MKTISKSLLFFSFQSKSNLISVIDVYEEEGPALLVSYNRKFCFQTRISLYLINNLCIKIFLRRLHVVFCFLDISLFKLLDGEHSSNFNFQWNATPQTIGTNYFSSLYL